MNILPAGSSNIGKQFFGLDKKKRNEKEKKEKVKGKERVTRFNKAIARGRSCFASGSDRLGEKRSNRKAKKSEINFKISLEVDKCLKIGTEIDRAS